MSAHGDMQIRPRGAATSSPHPSWWATGHSSLNGLALRISVHNCVRVGVCVGVFFCDAASGRLIAGAFLHQVVI